MGLFREFAVALARRAVADTVALLHTLDRFNSIGKPVPSS
jgi:hypothetical protein